MPQKRAPSGLVAPHPAHAFSSRAPHESQKRSPGRSAAAQTGHFMYFSPCLNLTGNRD
jgi:hypothetical protein